MAIDKTGQPFEPGHPFHGGTQIIFGAKRPDSLSKQSQDQKVASLPVMADDPNRPETEEDDGGRHMMGRVIQNFQFAARAKGLNLGPLSANEILEMADKGELKGLEESIEMVRSWVAKLGN